MIASFQLSPRDGTASAASGVGLTNVANPMIVYDTAGASSIEQLLNVVNDSSFLFNNGVAMPDFNVNQYMNLYETQQYEYMDT